MFSLFSIPRTPNFVLWCFLYAQQINKRKQPPFFPKHNNHLKWWQKKKSLCAVIKMKMKNNRILCTIKLSRHNQLLHHLHRCNLAKCEKFWIGDNGMFSSVAWLRLSACSWGVEALVFGPSFQKHHIWKMRWRLFCLFVWKMEWLGCILMAAMQNPTEECLTFKLGKGLISFCRFMFHFKAISQKCIKGMTHQLKHDLDQSWKSQHERPLTQLLWRLASIDWLQVARLHWTIVGQIWRQSQQQHKPPANIISANHNSFIIQFFLL